jgi:ABC-2 type transport system ATP-binding protein
MSTEPPIEQAGAGIEVSGLTKRYGDFTAVSDLSFTVRRGEVLGLVGPNGAGKTTTLRSIVGTIVPDSGTILLAGYDIAVEPVEAKRRAAFIPDVSHLFDYLTVRDHLLFTARLYGVSAPEPRIESLLAEFQLEEKRDQFPDELSRGMKQKVALACGLVHDPQVLLFDEPLTSLDPASIRRTKDAMLRRAREGAAVVLSSHLLSLVEELCDRVLIIQGGRQVTVGTIAEIRASRPELEGRDLEDIFLALTEQG